MGYTYNPPTDCAKLSTNPGNAGFVLSFGTFQAFCNTSHTFGENAYLPVAGILAIVSNYSPLVLDHENNEIIGNPIYRSTGGHCLGHYIYETKTDDGMHWTWG